MTALGTQATEVFAPARVAATAVGLCAWIESGACQTASGAFAAWLDATTGRPAFDYPEITGYALSFLAGRPSLSERAWAVGNRAAAWLVHRVQHGNLAARDGRDGEAVYLFDLSSRWADDPTAVPGRRTAWPTSRSWRSASSSARTSATASSSAD